MSLTGLHIWSEDGTLPMLPVTLLKGFAPRLRSLTLTRIPFPTLPQLLLPSNDLSELVLEFIPNLGYISPEAMVTGLSVLVSYPPNNGTIRRPPPTKYHPRCHP
jgi:hypothetical protein